MGCPDSSSKLILDVTGLVWPADPLNLCGVLGRPSGEESREVDHDGRDGSPGRFEGVAYSSPLGKEATGRACGLSASEERQRLRMQQTNVDTSDESERTAAISPNREEPEMALQSAIPVSFEASFPRGAFVVGEVERVMK